MGIIKRDDIIAAWIDEKRVCEKCITNEEWSILEEKDFVQDTGTDDLMFCDHCKKQI